MKKHFQTCVKARGFIQWFENAIMHNLSYASCHCVSYTVFYTNMSTEDCGGQRVNEGRINLYDVGIRSDTGLYSALLCITI